MISPRFSKICTEATSGRAPRFTVSSTQASTTRSMSATAMRARVRSWRGEKQSTRQTPDFAFGDDQPVLDPLRRRIGRSAAKSLSKTKVCL